jgi:hypothetical protein
LQLEDFAKEIGRDEEIFEAIVINLQDSETEDEKSDVTGDGGMYDDETMMMMLAVP